MKIKPPTQTRRSYPFNGVPVGGHLIARDNFNYFRSAASRWFKRAGRRYYTYTERDDRADYVVLVRLPDLPPEPAKRAPAPPKRDKTKTPKTTKP